MITLLIVTATFQAACDPCAGVVGCTGDPHVAASGRVLLDETGRPVAGVAIDFVRTGGASLAADSIRTITNAEGLFQFEIAAREGGTARGTIGVHPPEGVGYRVMDVELPTSVRRGEANSFPPWTTVPTLRDFAVLALRAVPQQIASDLEFEFHRTGGAAVDGMPGDVFRRRTSSDGWAPLFGSEVRPLEVGDVIGDLTVFFPAPVGPVVRRNLHVKASAVFRKQVQLSSLGVGPNMEHHIGTNRRGKYNSTVGGVRIEFRRTGGIHMTEDDWESVTDPGGRVVIPGRALESGRLTGDLRFIPPPPWKSFARNGVSFDTYDADGARLSLLVEIGPGVGAYARIHNNGVPIKGAEVEMRQTGGISLTPSPLKGVTNDTGFVYLTASTQAEGEVTGDVTVRPPKPYSAFVVHGVRLAAYDGDAPPPIIFGNWNVSNPPSSAIRIP